MVSFVLAPIVTLTSLVCEAVDEAEDAEAALRQDKTKEPSTTSRSSVSMGTPNSMQACRTSEGECSGSVGGRRLIDTDDVFSNAEMGATAASGLEVLEKAPES